MPRTTPKVIVDVSCAVWRLHAVRVDPGELRRGFLLDYKHRLSEIRGRVDDLEYLVDGKLQAAFCASGQSARTAPGSSRGAKLHGRERIFAGRLDERDDRMLLGPLRVARDSLEPSRLALLAAVDEIRPRSVADARMRLLFAVSFAAQLQTFRNMVRAHACARDPGLLKGRKADQELLRLDRSAENDEAWSTLAKQALKIALADREFEETHEGRRLGSLADLPPYDEQTQLAQFKAALGFDIAFVPEIPHAFLLAAIGELTVLRQRASEPVLSELGMRPGYSLRDFVRAFLDRFAGPMPSGKPRRADADKFMWARFRKQQAFKDARSRLLSKDVRATLGLLSAREEQEAHDDLLRTQAEKLRRQEELDTQQDAQKIREGRRHQAPPAAAPLRAVRGRVSARPRAQRGSSKKSS